MSFALSHEASYFCTKMFLPSYALTNNFVLRNNDIKPLKDCELIYMQVFSLMIKTIFISVSNFNKSFKSREERRALWITIYIS